MQAELASPHSPGATESLAPMHLVEPHFKTRTIGSPTSWVAVAHQWSSRDAL